MRTSGPRRAALIVATAAVMAAIPGSALVVSGPAAAAPTPGSSLYIVQVAGSPVATYTGGVAGIARTKPVEGERVDSTSTAAQDYAARLRSQHSGVLATAGIPAGAMRADYSVAFNGFAARVTEAEATRLRKTNGVVQVWKDEIRKADTVSTPSFLGLTGARGAWAKQFGGAKRAGLGVIVGIIDTGFWPESPSFAPLPEPRPDAARIARTWHGGCVEGVERPVSCNNKVIGARYYAAGTTIEDVEFRSPRDYNGHGSHTGSTAAGNNGVTATINGVSVGTASGMAPAARLAFYKALWAKADGTATGSTSDLVDAIDDAVGDGVDVINYSISGSSTYVVSPDEIAFLSAADAGVFVSTSAGNSGDTVGESSVAHNSPWTMTVAASSHDRGAAKSVTLGNSAGYTGVGVGDGVGPAPVVDSSTIALSGVSTTAATLCYLDADQDPDNGVRPALDPAKAAGKIVVCTRGTNARVEKSAAVKAAGGIGMILVNTSDAQSLNGDFHSVPTVHVGAADGAAEGAADGAAVKRYVASVPSPTATISATDTTPARAPEMVGFSSYGPAIAGGGDLLKPDITAPGVDVIAAVSPAGDPDANLYNAESGTSMSAPHIAGIAALVAQEHPKWSPMAIKSALMTTATTLDNTGAPIQRAGADATPLDYGAGHVRAPMAFRPGVVFDSNVDSWLKYACGIGQLQLVTTPGTCEDVGSIDPSDLNYPSISVGDLAGTQTVTRKVRNVEGTSSTYVATVQAPPGFTATVTPKRFTIAPTKTRTFTVTFTRTTAAFGEWSFGSLTLKGSRGQVARGPIALRPVSLSAPEEVTVSGASGSALQRVTAGYTGTLTTAVAGLVAADVTPVGTTLTRDGSTTVVVPVGTTVARFATYDADYAPGTDIDLVVIKGGAQVGSSGGPTAEEDVTLENPAPGTYTVVMDLFAGPASVDVQLNAFVLGSDGTGTLTATPSSQAVTTSRPAPVTIAWAGLDTSKRYLGSVTYGDGTSSQGRTLVSVRP